MALLKKKTKTNQTKQKFLRGSRGQFSQKAPPGRRRQKNDRLLTIIIIVVSLAGIFYFGGRAILENSKKNGENPFEYNIEYFKKSGAAMLHYDEVKQVKINLPKVYGIAVGPEDRLYVSGDNSVLIFDKKGGFLSTIKTAGTVYCLAVDRNGDVYLGKKDRIEVYDGSGAAKARWESLGEDAIITSIAISRQSVFVADAGSRVVLRFDKSGKLQGRIGEKNEAKDIPGFVIPSPYFDTAVDPDGFLWVVNPGHHSLENYTEAGDFRASWGKSSLAAAGFCGCCNPTHIAILEDGSFVTGEKGIARVKVYNRLGEFVSLVAGPDRFVEGVVGLDLAVDSAGRIYVLDPAKKTVRIFRKNKLLPRSGLIEVFGGVGTFFQKGSDPPEVKI
ncbi:MAG: NHL repeat-containing protein [Candidatus Aminicenantes bacterium]|nr:NHL repeat-containing protein [Candidatus Aminicenantes bacterium]